MKCRSLPLGLVLVLALLVGCNLREETIEARIVRWYDTHATGSQPCRLSVAKDIYPAEWDRICVFRHGATLQEVNQVLGVDVSDKYNEFTRKIVLVKGKQIIHWEEHSSDAEKPMPGEVAFEETYTANQVVFSRADAVFDLKRIPVGKSCYYVMCPAK